MVIAFEPNPADCEILRWNVSMNNLENILIVQAALSDTNGVADFATFDEPGVHHLAREQEPDDARLISVSCLTLDQVVFVENYPKPSLVKIDVEGAELAVLKGGLKLLREIRPVVAIEVWPETRLKVIEFMTNLGYMLDKEYNIYGGGVVDVVFRCSSS